MSIKTKILLSGASGTVGSEILKQLFQQKDKYDITVFDVNTKQSRKSFSKYASEINIIYGDISRDEDIGIACKNIDFAIHTAAIIPPLADEKPELAYRVNTIGTTNLVRNLEKYSPEAFLLYSSSISVYGDRLKNPHIYKTDPLIPSVGDEYAKTKIAAEEIIKSSKLKWSIFRLTAIMGGHKISKLMFHMPLATKMEICTPADTARAFVNGINHRKSIEGKIFNLGGGENCRCTYFEFLDRSFKIFGLGDVNFPDKAFADQNFHCGYYSDGDDLENIVKFRTDSLETYFKNEESKVSGIQKAVTRSIKGVVKNRLVQQSEPLEAIRKNDKELLNRFFAKKGK